MVSEQILSGGLLRNIGKNDKITYYSLGGMHDSVTYIETESKQVWAKLETPMILRLINCNGVKIVNWQK